MKAGIHYCIVGQLLCFLRLTGETSGAMNNVRSCPAAQRPLLFACLDLTRGGEALLSPNKTDNSSQTLNGKQSKRRKKEKTTNFNLQLYVCGLFQNVYGMLPACQRVSIRDYISGAELFHRGFKALDAPHYARCDDAQKNTCFWHC